MTLAGVQMFWIEIFLDSGFSHAGMTEFMSRSAADSVLNAEQ